MAKLIYITNMSLDGYIADEAGDFNWPNVDRIHPNIIEVLQPVGTYLYGRRLYELMAYWDAPVETYPPEHRDFARIWQKPQKIVYSRTLAAATTRSTRIERTFDPETVRQFKEESTGDITIGGADLASVAIEAGLVDECRLFVHPVILGGGKPAFRPGLRRNLELVETRPIGIGVLYVNYRIKT